MLCSDVRFYFSQVSMGHTDTEGDTEGDTEVDPMETEMAMEMVRYLYK